ncbi:MAG: ABC transporter permease [Acidobacteria bacterium]|nr:ABC transporter permease [Acidobacteriota bacterium]
MAIRVDYAVRETLNNIRRQMFMSVAVILVVAVSLYLVGGVLLLRFAVNRAFALQTANVEVTVFLARDVTPDLRDQIEKDLGQMPEVSRVTYESKQEAYRRFKDLFRDRPELVRNTSPDALPESFRVKLRDPKQFEVVRDRLQGRPGIDQIRDERSFLKQFFRVVDDVGRIGWILVGLLTAAGALLIGTTIRLAIFARRREIGIMRLVGATNWFIRVPFMMEGVFHGLVGAGAALALLIATRPLFVKVASSLQALQLSVSYGDIARYGLVLLLAGVLIGGTGSLFGLRRFLDV